MRERRFETITLVTAGGRVLTVVASGADYADAIARAYAGVERIHFEGMQYRRDIGKRAISAARDGGHSSRSALRDN